MSTKDEGVLGLPLEVDIVAGWFAELDAFSKDPSLYPSIRIQAISAALKYARHYYHRVVSRYELERRLERSLEPGGKLWTRLTEAGWIPPTPAAAPPNGANGKGEHVRH